MSLIWFYGCTLSVYLFDEHSRVGPACGQMGNENTRLVHLDRLHNVKG